MDCFSNATVNGEIGTSTRRQIILYNELDEPDFLYGNYGPDGGPIGPRAAQVEPCNGIKTINLTAHLQFEFGSALFIL